MEPLTFISQYNNEYRELISFAWNGKHSKEFEDLNQDYRRRIIEFIIENNHLYVPLELTRDIFLEESLWAIEAWCVYQKYHLIGERLLKDGGIKYIDDFLQGAFSSFDTYCSSRTMNIYDYDLISLINELKIRKRNSTDKETIKKYSSGIELFEKYIKGNPREGIVSFTGEVRVTNVKEIKPSSIHRIIEKLKKIKR